MALHRLKTRRKRSHKHVLLMLCIRGFRRPTGLYLILLTKRRSRTASNKAEQLTKPLELSALPIPLTIQPMTLEADAKAKAMDAGRREAAKQAHKKYRDNR